MEAVSPGTETERSRCCCRCYCEEEEEEEEDSCDRGDTEEMCDHATVQDNLSNYPVLQVDLRCQHNTHTSTAKSSKNTSCRAFMYLILKRQTYSKGLKSRSEDPHIKKGYYFHVVINNSHNHRVSCAAASAKKDVSKETTEKLKKLFESGHSPASALDTFKYDVYLQLPLHNILSMRNGYALFAQTGLNTCPLLSFPANNLNILLQPQDTRVLEDELARVFKSLTLKLRGDPSFIAPLTSFIASYDKMTTDSALQSAFSIFGKSPMAKATGYQRPKGYLQTTAQISVQLTAVGRRKACLGGRRTLPSGRPSKASREDHPYKRTGRKPAAPHSLAHCVEANMSLGGTH
ncbi:hypothetical protein ABVT39_017173 [Epinephelus coioides]